MPARPFVSHLIGRSTARKILHSGGNVPGFRGDFIRVMKRKLATPTCFASLLALLFSLTILTATAQQPVSQPLVTAVDAAGFTVSDVDRSPVLGFKRSFLARDPDAHAMQLIEK